MISKNILLEKLAPFQNNRTVIVRKQTIDNIVNGILATHKEYANEYDKIYKYFIGNNVEDTLQNIFDFLKDNVPYKIEPDSMQCLSSPSAILCNKNGSSDCKSYALFICGVADAYKRNENKNFNIAYRFAGYSNNKNIEHVFAVVTTSEKKYFWIDPVLPTFDTRIKQPTHFFDKKLLPMALVKINGIPQQNNRASRPQHLAFPMWTTIGKNYESVGTTRRRIGDTEDGTFDFLKNISISDIIDWFKNLGLSDGEKMKRGFVKLGYTPDQMLMWYVINKPNDWAYLHQAKEILIWDTPQISFNVADAFNSLIDKPEWANINAQYQVPFDLQQTKKIPVFLEPQYRGKNYVAPAVTPGGGGGGGNVEKKSNLLPIGLGLLAAKLLIGS
jgi:hypothetical protein